MNLIVRAAPPEHFPWLFDRTASFFAPAADFRAIEAIEPATGRIRGMIAYENWTPNSVQTHLALDAPIVGRALIGPAFAYPFVQAGVRIMLGIIPAHNARSVALARHVGFRETHRVIDGWSTGVDLIFFEMRKHECRYLKGEV